jgi:hypothetical protein
VYAIAFSLQVTILFFFSKPPTILSTSKSCLSTAVLLYRAAINAASLQFAISAPENPGFVLLKV